MDLRAALKQALDYQKTLDKKIEGAMTTATLAAIAAAADATPPIDEPNRTTGELKVHWGTDSQIAPTKSGNTWTTALANNKQYASYVNDGHRMDRHFVPGLVKTPFGLEYFPQLRGETGIMVGTKTQYVPGLHMTEAGKDAFSEAIHDELDGILEGL